MYFSFKTHLSDKPGNKEGKTSIETVAWNILIGDTIHNIADGIAIGVAFSTKVSVGISTSIAVFCHELPHELGKYTLLCLILCTVFLIFGYSKNNIQWRPVGFFLGGGKTSPKCHLHTIRT